MENDNKHNQTPLADSVLKKIEAHELTMHSKIYFTIKIIALFVLTALVLVLSSYICSFILFTIRQSSSAELLGFGPHGFALFLQVFPWGLFILDIVFIFILGLFLKHFSFGYRNPVLYISLAILIIVISLAALIDYNRFDDFFLQQARDNHIPVIGNFYDQGRRPPSPETGACRCVVLGIQGNILTMREDSSFGSTTVIAIVPQNIATSSLYIGEKLFLLGAFKNGNIYVTNIHSIN
jgi:hypothetical protein